MNPINVVPRGLLRGQCAERMAHIGQCMHIAAQGPIRGLLLRRADDQHCHKQDY